MKGKIQTQAAFAVAFVVLSFVVISMLRYPEDEQRMINAVLASCIGLLFYKIKILHSRLTALEKHLSSEG